MGSFKYKTLSFSYPQQKIEQSLYTLGYTLKGNVFKKELKKDRLRILIDKDTLQISAEKISRGDYLMKWKPTRLKHRYLKHLKSLMVDPKDIIDIKLI